MIITIVARIAAIVQAIYPGFSRGSILAQTRTNNPIYQGIAPRKKPIINLQNRRRNEKSSVIHKEPV
uniref:60S ribosomal protein L18a plant n=1 Tax=Rhizophora mucronata TaxID=61149 RepID=A0A2P2JEL9_RHIMU